MAEDRFEQYYTEKLWEMIPAIYRYEDGMADEPGVLRALVAVFAKQAAILRRSQDRLWDDQFIELCNEWAVPYIGDLVATRLLSALNKRGRRIDVAKTIFYRRRNGTPRILEELTGDISGWEGKLVEQFQKLGRARHGLDPQPGLLRGRYSGTLPGGWADLRNQRISELSNGPFEEYFHTPDMRRHQGLNGRYNIPKLAFYLYRLRAFQAIDITPFSLGDGLRFTFDPSGRDIPLFSKSLRSSLYDWDEWHSAFEWELPAPVPCRLLAHAEYSFGEEIIQKMITSGLSAAAAGELRQLSGLRFKNENSLMTIIHTFSNQAELLTPNMFTQLLSFALVPDCGKQALLPDADTLLTDPQESSSVMVGFQAPVQKVFSVEAVTAANLSSWSVATTKELAIDPEKGRFMLLHSLSPRQVLQVAYSYGFSGPTGAGNYERPGINPLPDKLLKGGGVINVTDMVDNGTVQIEDSKTYTDIPDQLNIIRFVFQSSSNQRPYLHIKNNWILDSGTHEDSILILDGLWIGSAGDKRAKIIVRGNYECVIIKNCTLDPGGSKNANNETLLPLQLSIEGFIENLCIESSIMGPVMLESTGNVEEISISDSIIQSVETGINALTFGKGVANISRTTIFGQAGLHRLEATEVIITDLATVTDTQHGCFRFSAAPAKSRLPRPYESFLFLKDANHWFTSRRFGDPGYAQLSETAPGKISRGAENGSETGAFCKLLNPIKLDGLQAKIDEYMPFGLIPIFIYKT